MPTELSFTLKIAGSVINRNTAGLTLMRLHRSIDEYDVFEFFELGSLPGAYACGQSVQVIDSNAIVRFSGQVVGKHPGFASIGWGFGYTCYGLKYQANLIAVTNANSGAGLIQYNLPTTDPLFIPSNSGLSVGTILGDVFTAHSTQLTAAGVTSYNSADLTGLTMVPTRPVNLQGAGLFDAVEQFLQTWYPGYCTFVDPNTATFRVLNANSFGTTYTLTLGTDAVDPERLSLSQDTSQCFTRLVVRGSAWIEAAILSVVDGSLTPAWTSGQQSAWNWSNWISPTNAVDAGTVTGLTANSCTCTSSNTAETWSVNQWSTAEGLIWLLNPIATGITFSECRRISSNATMAAGGTANIAWTSDNALQSSGYTNYRIIAQPSGGEIDVWRRYNITNAYIAGHLYPYFPIPVPWANNSSIEMLTGPQGAVDFNYLSGTYSEAPAGFELDQQHGQIRFFEPVVKVPDTLAELNAGGSSVIAPYDVKAVVPFSRGALKAVAPGDSGGSITGTSISGTQSGYSSASPPTGTIFGDGSGATLGTPVISGGVITSWPVATQGSNYTVATVQQTGGTGSGAIVTPIIGSITPVYSGTAFTANAIQRTYYLDFLDWIDPRQTASFALLAANHLAVLNYPVIQGTVPTRGVFSTPDLLTLGYALNLAGNGYTTGWESLAATVRAYDLEWLNQSNDGSLHALNLHVSNRRKPATGDDLYIHPAFSGSRWWNQSSNVEPVIGEGGSLLSGSASASAGADTSAPSILGGSQDDGAAMPFDMGFATDQDATRTRSRHAPPATAASPAAAQSTPEHGHLWQLRGLQDEPTPAAFSALAEPVSSPSLPTAPVEPDDGHGHLWHQRHSSDPETTDS